MEAEGAIHKWLTLTLTLSSPKLKLEASFFLSYPISTFWCFTHRYEFHVPTLCSHMCLGQLFSAGTSIHPSIHCQLLIQSWVAGTAASAASAVSPRLPSPWPGWLTLTGESQALPGQRRDIIPPPGPGSTPRSPPSWTCQEHLPRKAPWLHPHWMPEPPQLASFHAEEQWLYCESLPDG